jgi:hypothetical protein
MIAARRQVPRRGPGAEILFVSRFKRRTGVRAWTCLPRTR